MLEMKFRLSSFVPSSLVDGHYHNRSERQASVIGGDASISANARTDTTRENRKYFPYLGLTIT